jgi:OOP family OmpA-OmpF porin
MNRAIAVIFTILFLIAASIIFLWLRPVELPAPLKPVGTWFDERKSALVDAQGNETRTNSAAAIEQTRSQEEPKQVDLAESRSAVAQVTVDGKGGSTVKTAQIPENTTSGASAALKPAITQTDPAAQTQAATVDSSKPAQPTGASATAASSAVAAVADAAASAASSQPESTASTASAAKVTEVVEVAKADTAEKTSPAVSSVVSSDGADRNDAATSDALREKDSAAADATNALAAVSARNAQRAAALERAERQFKAQAPTQGALASASSQSQNDTASIAEPKAEPTAETTTGQSGNTETTPPDSPAGVSDSTPSVNQPAPVALLKPEVKTRRPVTAAAVRQQQTITNYLEGRRVEFEVGRDVLSPRGIAVLDRLVPLIKANQGTSITIQGHTDDVGDYASNLELSGARAIAARNYLISRGIKQNRLKVQGMGERIPIADNNTRAGRIKNRRIDFAVSDAG